MNRIKVVVESAPWEDSVDILIVAGHEPYTARVDGNKLAWEKYPENTRPPATLRVSPEVWQAIMREAGNYTQHSDATVDALKDARTVRDRLLTMIERT